VFLFGVCDEGGFYRKLYVAAAGKTDLVLGILVVFDEMCLLGLLGCVEHVLFGAVL